MAWGSSSTGIAGSACMDVLDGGLGRLSSGGALFVRLGKVACGLKSQMEGGGP
jgi:hypothetical protein